ncbi:hypothetical protein [Salidesulfovibrio brasiliensis]|uniref:hypothetical protein n=1 Tax=Salidesulfovibrio brasiliensis TaxID=221711 RepID=UPI000AEEFE38|nr:hypothetical protein [Salidesulfovibrio brasiliensis]
MNRLYFKRICLLLSLLLVLVAGCTGSDIDVVKNGVMRGYQTTTVGAAFDASFDNPQWSEFEGEKGERVVEFTGKIRKDVLLDLIGNVVNEPSIQNSYAKNVLSESEYQQFYEGASGEGTTPTDEVYKVLFNIALDKVCKNDAVFQWIVTPDGKGFSLSYVDNNAWGPGVAEYGASKKLFYRDHAILDAVYN